MIPQPWMDPLHYDPAVQYEIRMVRYTLKALGLADREPELRRLRSEEIDGRRELSFEALGLALPTFPVLVRVRYGRSRNSRTGALPEEVAGAVTNFERSAIGRRFRAAQDALEDSRSSRAIALVFPFARVHGGWVLHDGDFPTRQDPQRLTIETRDGPVRFERYADVLKAIRASHWSPEGSLVHTASADESPAPPEPPPLDRGWPVPRLIRLLLGRCAEADVLGMMWQLQTRRLRGRQCRFIQRRGGLRYVVLPLRTMAGQLGLGRRRLQQAVANLRRDGLLVVERGFDGPGNPSGYVVPDEMIVRIAEDEGRR